jgi:hypothetical protein
VSVDQQRYVVWMPDQSGWEMAAAKDPASEGVILTGGLRELHELAVAISATGRQVQVRGWVDLEELRALSDAAGVATPDLASEAARPSKGDVVVMPEGHDDPLTYAHVALSAARAIIMLLAPSGLFGWPFVEGWSKHSPLRVAIESVARPEHFRAMDAMGFELWTTMPALAERVEAAGIACGVTGAGRALPYPEPEPKRYDVVTFANNRWSELARQVVSRLDSSIVHHEIPAGSNVEILRQFGQARVLVHPLRVEGDSRIGVEARAMGAVPVVLNSNPFSVGLDEDGGAVAVSTLEEMSAAVAELLDDDQRLAALRERGMQSAREQLDWDSYVQRVDSVLSRPPREDHARGARGVMGDRLMWQEQATARKDAAESADLRAHLEELDGVRDLLVGAEQRLAELPELQLRISDLELELAESRKAAEDARKEARSLDEWLMRSQRTYADVINSPSWRLTKPLRAAKRLLNRG